MSAFFGKFLLIDNHPDFIDEVLEDAKLIAEFPVVIQKTVIDGTKLLEKQRNSVRGLIISTHYFKTVDELKQFQSQAGDIPILYLSHAENHSIRGELNSERIIVEPKSYEEIVNVLRPFVEKRADWKSYQESKDEKFVELSVADGDFLRINIKDFMILPKAHFNLYIKIGQGNFIKIVNAGEENVEDILAKYSGKGFPHVYIPVTEHERYVALCEKMSKQLLNSGASVNEKAKQIFRLGNEVVKSITKLGLEPKSLDYAESFMDQSISLIKNYQVKDGNLQKFISSIEGNEHLTAVSFLAGVLANELGFESVKSVKLVGISALVHDVGLYDLSPDAEEEQLPSDSDVMMKHAKHGADLLRKSGCFDEVVCIAVEQHHHRRRGVSTSKRDNNMNLVSEIVGVTDLFYNSVIKGGFNPKKLDLFLAKELSTFSLSIEKGMLKVLDKKRKTG